MTENKPFKLNLWALKNNAIDDSESISISKNKDSIISNDENKESIISFNKDEINNLKENKINEKIHKIDLSQMKTQKENKVNEKKDEGNKVNEKKDEGNEVNEKKDKEVFLNYESEFNKEKDTILQKIEKFKNFVKPKTRLWFLIRITWVTVFWIAYLFIIAPDKHNLENYKANLFIVKQNIECKFDELKCNKENNKIIKKEITQINKKTLKKEIFVIEYKSKIVNWKEIIIYNWKDYTKEEFELKIKDIIKKKKIKKLQEFLLKNAK